MLVAYTSFKMSFHHYLTSNYLSQRGMIQIRGHGAPKKTPKKTFKNPKTYLK
jgi:hypothetical protein